ncbi:portal protein [Acinetobacter baumannii]|uniref:portal protein n=1 Tax=Acinetobacter baumannii TaxID=470 RepID=UPI0021CA78F7|nr:portal protein [Acinetobacter baumannii]
MVKYFGLDNVSDAIKNAFENKNYEQEFEVCHAIYERVDQKGMDLKTCLSLQFTMNQVHQ